MPRIAIIGNAGGGKSVLAQKIGAKYLIPVYEFDTLQWKPGWVQAPQEEITATHHDWLSQPGWVIDGWGSWEQLRERFEAADTLIFVDYALYVHYWWAVKRQIKAIFGRSNGWPPNGCKAFPVTGRLFKLMWAIHKEKRPKLAGLIEHYQDKKQVIHLHSPREMRKFLASIGSLM